MNATKPTPYGIPRLVQDLRDTANGVRNASNSLRVAKDLGCVTNDDRYVLDGMIAGRVNLAHRLALLQLAQKIEDEHTEGAPTTRRYVKITNAGVSSLNPMEDAVSLLREAFKTALTTDVFEVQFLDLTDDEYKAYPACRGW